MTHKESDSAASPSVAASVHDAPPNSDPIYEQRSETFSEPLVDAYPDNVAEKLHKTLEASGRFGWPPGELGQAHELLNDLLAQSKVLPNQLLADMTTATIRIAALEKEKAELERQNVALLQRCEIYGFELARAGSRVDHLAKILTRIHSFVLPDDVKLPDGRVMRFGHPEVEREMLRGLSDAIKAVPAALAESEKG